MTDEKKSLLRYWPILLVILGATALNVSYTSTDGFSFSAGLDPDKVLPMAAEMAEEMSDIDGAAVPGDDDDSADALVPEPLID